MQSFLGSDYTVSSDISSAFASDPYLSVVKCFSCQYQLAGRIFIFPPSYKNSANNLVNRFK
jgi:hypothetical protein